MLVYGTFSPTVLNTTQVPSMQVYSTFPVPIYNFEWNPLKSRNMKIVPTYDFNGPSLKFYPETQKLVPHTILNATPPLNCIQ